MCVVTFFVSGAGFTGRNRKLLILNNRTVLMKIMLWTVLFFLINCSLYKCELVFV
nr:MAG TPA: hypothetical protein [Caudoviricetes sp.]